MCYFALKFGINHLSSVSENNNDFFMETADKIKAYKTILESVNSKMGQIDQLMTALVGEYEKLNRLHEMVCADIVLTEALFDWRVKN